MEVTWLGHAAFLLEGDDRVLVDPFLSENPTAAISAEEVECDLVCSYCFSRRALSKSRISTEALN